jgi:hypothetical protein
MTEFDTYQGASTISRKTLDLKGSKISIFELDVVGVLFDKRITWRLHIQMIEIKAFRTFITIYSLLKSEQLCTNIKLTLHKALKDGLAD